MNFLSKLFWSAIEGYNHFKEPDWSLPVETKITSRSIDQNGYPVIHVQAANYREVARVTAGTTYPGDVIRSHVHTGENEWEIRIESFNTQIKQPGDMTTKEYQEYIDRQRGA